jgi:tryptophan-rich sensory protein
LIGWLAAGFVTGALGAIASIHAAEFYAQLARPAWSPPAYVFGPAWTTLYVLMSVAAWLVWRVGGWSAHAPALRLFVLQLVLNALWSWLFFAWHLGALAFVDICVLWLLVLLVFVRFLHTSRAAGMLLIPYLAWLGYAGALCYRVWRSNSTLLG